MVITCNVAELPSPATPQLPLIRNSRANGLPSPGFGGGGGADRLSSPTGSAGRILDCRFAPINSSGNRMP
jgi:hypothetical protein